MQLEFSEVMHNIGFAGHFYVAFFSMKITQNFEKYVLHVYKYPWEGPALRMHEKCLFVIARLFSEKNEVPLLTELIFWGHQKYKV